MPIAKLAALLAALAVLVAGCGNGDDNGADTSAEPPDSEDVSTSQDDRGAELSDDVAAVVNGQDIPAANVDEQIEAFSDNPQIAEQLEGEQGEQTRMLLRAQILSSAIVTQVAVESAEELGQPVTDDDVAQARSELEEQTGGAEELETALEEEGLTDSQLDLQLQALAALRNIEQALEEEGGEDAGGEQAPGGEGAPSASEQRAQQFVGEQLAAADVVVNDDYGSWDAQSGQVTPPGGAMQAPAPVPEEEGAEPAPDAGS